MQLTFGTQKVQWKTAFPTMRGLSEQRQHVFEGELTEHSPPLSFGGLETKYSERLTSFSP